MSDAGTMGKLGTKITRLFLPWAMLALALTVIYSTLNWLLVAGDGPVPLDEDLANLWLPGILSFALVFKVVHPRLRQFSLNEKRGIPFLYDLLAAASIAAPLALLQLYIGASTGHLEHVATSADVARLPQAKFYAIDAPCFDRGRTVADAVYADDDDRGDMISITLYAAVPACENPSVVWLGYRYRDVISNRISDAEQKAKIGAFARETDKALNAENFGRYQFFERAGNNADHRAFTKAVHKNNAPTNAIVLIPREGAFADRAARWLRWAMISAAVLGLAWLIAVLIPPLKREDEIAEPQQKPVPGPTFTDILVPKSGNYGLPLLLDINIFVYLAMVFAGLGVMSFPIDDLLDWGASYRPAIHGLGVLRLITSQFVHGGFLHIANNMQGLLFAAICLSPVARNARLILCYLLCGLGGSIASVLHSVTVSVGASGAIFGLYGILLVLYALKDSRIRALGPAIWSSASLFVGLNLVFGFTSPSTDNAGHIGGLLTGLVLGPAIFLLDRNGRSIAR
jgi:membrane associated rhomboid family serine protease